MKKLSDEEWEEIQVFLFNVEIAVEDIFKTMASVMAEVNASIIIFCDAVNEAIGQEVAKHPDLAELNIAMDAFYPRKVE